MDLHWGQLKKENASFELLCQYICQITVVGTMTGAVKVVSRVLLRSFLLISDLEATLPKFVDY